MISVWILVVWFGWPTSLPSSHPVNLGEFRTKSTDTEICTRYVHRTEIERCPSNS